MKYSKRSSKIVPILVTVIISVLFLSVWFVWHSKNASDRVNEATEQVQNSSTAQVDIAVPFNRLPSELQLAIIDQNKIDAPACVKDGQLVDAEGKPMNPQVSYLKSGYALGGIGCDGGAAALFVKDNGNWKFVSATQMAFNCAELKKYKVPARLVAQGGSPAKCFEGESPNATEVNYTD